jgi:hypothetical protein
VSTVDPIESALAGQQPDAGAPEAADGAPSLDHPALARYDGDPVKALDAFQELQRTFGSEGHRLGQENAALREQLAAYEQQQQVDQNPPRQDGVPDLNVDQLQEWYAEDPVQATAYMMEMNNQVLRDQLKQDYDSRLAPIESNVAQSSASSLVENLGKALGPDVVERNEAEIKQMIKDDPGFFKGDTATQFKRMKTVILAAEYERGTPRGASQDGGAATRNVAVEGGSGGRTPQDNQAKTPVDEFLAELGSPGQKKGLFGLDIAP